VRQFKVLNTLAQLELLLRELRSFARRIILFGSCTDGTDTANSDVDLFILAAERSPVMAAISHCPLDRPIQPVVVNNQELAAMKQAEPAFYAQAQRGIVLWETI